MTEMQTKETDHDLEMQPMLDDPSAESNANGTACTIRLRDNTSPAALAAIRRCEKIIGSSKEPTSIQNQCKTQTNANAIANDHGVAQTEHGCNPKSTSSLVYASTING